MILVDSCVLIDILDQDQAWRRWSAWQLEASFGAGLVDPVIIAELHGRDRDSATIAELLETYALSARSLPPEAAPIAGAALRRYRERGGRQHAILADFLIGAHAAVLGATLLTRDRARFQGYFPELPLITPESAHP